MWNAQEDSSSMLLTSVPQLTTTVKSGMKSPVHVRIATEDMFWKMEHVSSTHQDPHWKILSVRNGKRLSVYHVLKEPISTFKENVPQSMITVILGIDKLDSV